MWKGICFGSCKVLMAAKGFSIIEGHDVSDEPAEEQFVLVQSSDVDTITNTAISKPTLLRLLNQQSVATEVS